MDKFSIRKSFAAAIGAEKYQAFLQSVQGSFALKGRLKYRQEQEWLKFCERMGLAALGFDEIRDLFQYCRVHGDEFQDDEVPIVYGTRSAALTPALQQAEQLYPNANTEYYGPCWHEPEKSRKVKFCPACRAKAPVGSNLRPISQTCFLNW